ncbi:tetratricopeptide (TPR) repeat protein [Constrictibacter sp. MBR-5]|jgi:tetratricopeptide (TPR) repeat protein|uniref:tetratricopeptide repeat protein n=1 Tax=Constrictibacter sp. MBR-5 TaxID=3156467 RepID=UPI003398015E
MSVTDALKRGIAMQSAGDAAGAERVYRAVLQLDANNPDALNLLGTLRLGAGRAAEAAELAGRAVAARPAAVSYRHNLARALQADGRLDAAVEQYAEAARLAPHDAGRHENLAAALRAAKRMDEAVAAFRRALALEPKRASALVALGDTLQEMDDLDGAVAQYRAAIAVDAGFAAGHNNLGSALHKQGRGEAALAAYAAAVKLEPRNARYRINLGVAQFAAGDFAAALAAFEACLLVDPFDRRGVAYREIALAALGRLDRAASAEALQANLHPVRLGVPEGWPDMAAFNAELARDLMNHRSLRWDAPGTATTGGGDVLLLLQHPTPAITAFERTLRRAIDACFDGLERVPGHPFLDRIPRDWGLDIWGTVLKAQGHQAAHIHPTGWMSGVYYVQLPEGLGSGEDGDLAGWIEFGRPADSFRVAYEPVVETARPEEGLAIFFPSYVYHRTVPFDGPRARISIAFDVRPRSFR